MHSSRIRTARSLRYGGDRDPLNSPLPCTPPPFTTHTPCHAHTPLLCMHTLPCIPPFCHAHPPFTTHTQSAMHASLYHERPLVNRITDRCKNITFPQLHLGAVIIDTTARSDELIVHLIPPTKLWEGNVLLVFVCLFTGEGSHVTITHDALDLTVHRPPSHLVTSGGHHCILVQTCSLW